MELVDPVGDTVDIGFMFVELVADLLIDVVAEIEHSVTV